MKTVKAKGGEDQLQPEEYVPDGPIRIAPNASDPRGRLNSDGTKSALVAERPVYVPAGAMTIEAKRLADRAEWSLKINEDGSREVKVVIDGAVRHHCTHSALGETSTVGPIEAK